MEDKKISKAFQMRQHIEACEAGGRSVEEYCREQNVKPSTYYYWRKKLLSDEAKSNHAAGSFIPVPSIPQSSGVELIFTNGIKIHFEHLVPVEYLKQLVY